MIKMIQEEDAMTTKQLRGEAPDIDYCFYLHVVEGKCVDTDCSSGCPYFKRCGDPDVSTKSE